MRRLNLAIVLAVLSVYSFPYLATSVRLRSQQIPFAFAPDLSLYLNLSMIGRSQLNPYFGTPLHSGEMGYMTFDTAFKLFHIVLKFAGTNLWWGVFAWNLVWWTATCVGMLWFLRMAFPQARWLLICVAVTLLFFFNFGLVKPELLAWIRLPSFSGFDGLTLPDIRVVFPQVPLALMFPYLALQVRALQSWSMYDWAWMCFLQAAGFAMFPYATLLIALTTGAAVVATFVEERRFKRLRIIALYGALCAAADILFLILRLPHSAQHSNQPLIILNLPRAVSLVGGGFMLLLLLTVATAIIPAAVPRAAKWTVAALGLANLLLMLGDTVFSPALLVSVHAGYFIHTTITLEIAYLICAAFSRFGWESPRLKTACFAIILLTASNGLLLARASGRNSLAENKTTNDFVRTIRSLNITKEDLVITRADTVDDLCGWVPLVTPAKVLFCRSAQYELSIDEKRNLYRLRQAFYLYFTGKDDQQIERVASDSGSLTQQDRLAFASENPANSRQWEEAKAAIRADLVPLLSHVEMRDAGAGKFFSSYSRVVVVDDAINPTFDRERLASYFSVKSETRIGDFLYYWCTPL